MHFAKIGKEVLNTKFIKDFIQPADNADDDGNGEESITFAANCAILHKGAVINQKSVRFVVLSDNNLIIYDKQIKSPLSLDANKPVVNNNIDKLNINEDNNKYEIILNDLADDLDDSFFIDSIDDASECDSAPASAPVPSNYPVAVDKIRALISAIKLNNLNQLSIPAHTGYLKSCKVIETIPLANILEVLPVPLKDINEMQSEGIEIQYLDNLKKKNFYLLPSSEFTFEFYPYVSSLFPCAFLSHWLDVLRQAANLPRIKVVAF